MAIRYYDDAIVDKLKKWIPENSVLRILKPDETRRLFELSLNDNNDKPLKLPFISLSRNSDIELLSNIKELKSYNGLKLADTVENENKIPEFTPVLNVIPIKPVYQLDIYTKNAIDGDEYLRTFLFKLINNPTIKIEIPYNSSKLQKQDPDVYLEHKANIRLMSTVSDTSAVDTRLFSGQFNRWTIQFELQDAFLFSVPYKRNWRFNGADGVFDESAGSGIILETADNLTTNISDIEYEETFNF